MDMNTWIAAKTLQIGWGGFDKTPRATYITYHNIVPSSHHATMATWV